MRPYLAVLKDSFREAFASRVLWFVVIATTVVLLFAGPLGIMEDREGANETYVSYFTFRALGPFPISLAQVTQLIQQILAVIVDYVVGGFAVFAAILVTASIIPQMFEPGAIDLLLSKPVSRPLLFLTKFVGGCAFIALNAAYFILGLWLIAGARFGIWSHKLFLCIPVLLFLFAIYYSVSALAGVLWRNAIVSVIVTVLFWAMCFSLRLTKAFIENQWIRPERLVKLVPAGETLLAVTEQDQVRAWRPGESKWYDVFSGDTPRHGGFVMRKQVLSPVYDARRDRLVAIENPPAGGGFNLFGSASTLLLGRRTGDWARTKGPPPPSGALALFSSPKGEIVVVTRGTV